jgi:hypothetical protein
MTKLYELTSEFSSIQRLADVDEFDGEEIQAKLDSLQLNIEGKVEGICKFLRGLEAERDAVDAEVVRLKRRTEGISKGIEFFRHYMKGNLDSVGIDKIKTPLFSVSIYDSAPKVIIKNLSDVPNEFMVTFAEERVDKEAILATYKTTGEIPRGTDIVRGRTIRIT